MEPRARLDPLASNRTLREVEQLSYFLFTKSNKEPVLNDLPGALVHLPQSLERSVKRHQFRVPSARRNLFPINTGVLPLSPVLLCIPAACAIYKDLPHGTRRHREEMLAVPDVKLDVIGEFEVGLVNQGGRMEGVARAFSPQLLLGDSSQVRINRDHKAVESLTVAIARLYEQPCYFEDVQIVPVGRCTGRHNLFSLMSGFAAVLRRKKIRGTPPQSDEEYTPNPELLMATVPQFEDAIAERRDALAEQILWAASSAMQLFTIYLGDQLGLYEVLAADGPMSANELARRTGTAPRYVREWLEQQSVAGILEVENAHDSPDRRRFYLPDGHEEVLADRESVNYLAPLPQVVAGVVAPIQQLLSAWRSGTGVPYEAYGRTMVEGQARMNRAAFLHQLAPEWLPALPGLQERLEEVPTRIADIGCGAGWSSIGMARHYPQAEVHGFDLDPASIEMAVANAAEAGVTDRVSFQVRDAADSEVAGTYDLVTALECVHDMSNPVAALQTMRRLVRPDGYVLVVDERVADHFDPTAAGMESLMYGFSVLHCLPVGLAEHPSVGTGTVMRRGTLRRYALDAGFADVEVLPIDHPMFRFYWLKQ